MDTGKTALLLTFDNPQPDRDYTIQIRVPEFTCLCPMTKQPDFATLEIDYVPNSKCIELKSLKLYTMAYRNEGAYHEALTNRILNDLSLLLEPRFMRLRALFNARGGIHTTVIVEYRQEGWQALPAQLLPDDR